MEAQISRVTIHGLRSSDPASLSVLVQDVLHLPMSQIEPRCLMDLMALSEARDQLPKQLGDRALRILEDPGPKDKGSPVPSGQN